MCVVLSERTVTLQSEDGDVLDVMFHTTDGSVEYNISHISSSQVEMDGTPVAWETDTCDYDCMELQCHHKFKSYAFVFHFLTNYMTCPLCQYDVQTRILLACVPENIK
jgi:hypothetical protein